MASAITGVATLINEIESHAHFTHCHGYTLQLAVGETIKAIKIMRGTLDKLLYWINVLYGFKIIDKKIIIKCSPKREGASNRLREDTALGNSDDRVFFLSGFSFTNIHDSKDNRGRRRVSI